MIVLVSWIILIILLLAFLGLVLIPRVIGLSKKQAPYVPTRGGAITEIIKLLKLKDGSVMYDLGCGDGKVLFASTNSAPNISGLGIENDWLPILLSRFRRHSTGAKVIKGNLFTTPLRDATHIYCYLFPEVMSELEPKVIAECPTGTRIVSCDFPFPQLTPSETIVLHSNKYRLASKLYLYVM